MDFNEIKNTWKDSFKRKNLLDKQQIEILLRIKGRSNTALKKIKKSYVFEIVAGAIMYFVILAGLTYFINTSSVLIFIALVTALMGLPYLFTWRVYNRIRNTVISDRDLKQTLAGTISVIDKFVRYSKSNFNKYLLIPFAVITGTSMGLFIKSGDKSFLETILSLESGVILYMVVMIIILSAAGIILSNYMTKKKYKQHLDELKKSLNEFEETVNK